MRRILIGALAGALLTLLLHPASRRYVFTPFVDIGRSPSKITSVWIPENLAVLPAPSDTITASLWTQAGADVLLSGKPIEPKTLIQLIDVCEAAARGEPTNAYWLQMEAVFRWKLGERDLALERWKRASICEQWDDYQSRRLGKLRDELSTVDGGRMAWHTATAYFERSSASSVTIVDLARAIFRSKRYAGREALDLRLATLRNGRLLRDWSRSVSVGAHGASLVNFVAMPTETLTRPNVREEILARFELINLFRLDRRSREALEVDEIFRTNDAWLALAEPTRAADAARQLSWVAILLASVPGILIGLSLVGLAIRGGVWILEAAPRAQILLRLPYAAVLGVLAGIGLYLQTGLVLAAVAVSMCFGFLAFEPERTRKRMPDRMRLGFRWTVLALAALFSILLGMFWLGITTPALEVIPNLGVPIELFGGNTICLSLAVLVLSLLLLAAPGWAIVERIPTTFATVFTFREFARRLTWGGIALGIVSTPIAVYWDGQARESMDRLLANEPAVYLLREQ